MNEMYRGIVEIAAKRFAKDNWARSMGYYRSRPGAFARKILGSTWWSAQEEVARAISQYRRVAVRSGNGVGKTYLAADIALWFLYTHRPALVVTSAPTARQVRHVLWQEIRRRWAQTMTRLPGRLLHTRIEVDSHSFAIGLSTDGSAAGVKFQGFHSENLLIILDEASGIPDEIWDAAEGVAVGDNNRILAIGNPLRAAGRFYSLFKGNHGWRKLTINALAHPNVTGKGRTIPGCVNSSFIEDKIADWCEEESSMGSMGVAVTPILPILPNSHTPDTFTWRKRRYNPNDLFRARILGEFPRSEENALIPLAWVESAQTRVIPPSGNGLKRAAADVARFGDDWTIIGVRIGPTALPVIPIKGANLMEVAGAIVRVAYDEQPSGIAVDSIGIGAGVVDRLMELGIDGIEPVNVSSRAHDDEHFANRRAELYWGLRSRFRDGEIVIPDDPIMAEELASIRYLLNSRGQIQIERKAEMKKRLGRSPDRADMLAMLFDSSAESLALWEPTRPARRSQAAILREEMAGW